MAQRFTVYDVMEAKGVFKKNPANIGAQNEQGIATYSGPVQYPKMLYHPAGEERITQQGDMVMTPLGPQRIMQQRELISKIVHTQAEEAELVSAGWHTHPAHAMKAAGKEAPATGADQVIAELQRKIAELQTMQASLLKATPPEVPPAPKPVPKAEPVHPLSKPAA